MFSEVAFKVIFVWVEVSAFILPNSTRNNRKISRRTSSGKRFMTNPRGEKIQKFNELYGEKCMLLLKIRISAKWSGVKKTGVNRSSISRIADEKNERMG